MRYAFLETVRQYAQERLETAGEANEPRWHDPMEFLAIGFDPALVAASFGDALRGGMVRLPPVRGEADPVAARLSAVLRQELVETSFFGPLFGETAALAFARHLLGRYGTEMEIAEAVVFLCSPAAGYVNGQTLAVDGGFDATGIGLPTLRAANRN